MSRCLYSRYNGFMSQRLTAESTTKAMLQLVCWAYIVLTIGALVCEIL